MNGIVNTVARTGSRLFVGGTFTQIGGQARGGHRLDERHHRRVDSFVDQHGHGQPQLDRDQRRGQGAGRRVQDRRHPGRHPDGRDRQLQVRRRAARATRSPCWNLPAPTAELRTDWQTHRYAPACFNWAFDCYIRDVAFSPDGSYFVITATGGGNGTLCDTAARFETNASGTDVQPTWVDYTGGDTVWRRDHRHRRLRRRPHALDEQPARLATSPAAGAVPRPGLAALDPINGMPLQLEPRPQPARRRRRTRCSPPRTASTSAATPTTSATASTSAAEDRVLPARRRHPAGLDRGPGAAGQRLPRRLPQRRRATCSTGSTPAAARSSRRHRSGLGGRLRLDRRQRRQHRRLEPGAERRRHGPGEHPPLDLRQRALGRRRAGAFPVPPGAGQGPALLRQPVLRHLRRRPAGLQRRAQRHHGSATTTSWPTSATRPAR